MIQRKIQAKKVCYNLKTGIAVKAEDRDKDCIFFDSESEYRLFRLLNFYFPYESWDIEIHKQLLTNLISWKIDFKLTPKTNNLSRWEQLTNIATIVNGVRFSYPITSLWIEYKGHQDKNFLTKFTSLKTNNHEICKAIILVSDSDSAYGFFSKDLQKFLIHPIIGISNLESILKAIL